MFSTPLLSIVIPCFNESGNLNALMARLTAVLTNELADYEIIFVDDGSIDKTFELVTDIHNTNSRVRGLSLSRNFGHQIALAAGLHHSRGKVVITMDGDLQHPPEIIPELVSLYHKGNDIVNTLRMDTEGVGGMKKSTSKLFYKILNRLSEVHIDPGAADFRLMSRKAVDAYAQFDEKDRFNRGLVGWMGFSQAVVKYKAESRYAGKTKYTLKRMIHFALDGVTSFSSKPLRIAAYSGVFVSLVGLLYALYALIRHFRGDTIQGWTSLLITVLVLGGVQLISLGIIGEYIARIFNESKSRPLYFIKNTTPTLPSDNEKSTSPEKNI